MLMLLAPLKHLSEINNALQRGLAAAESVFGMIDAPVEEDRGTVALGRARGRDRVREGRRFTYPDAHRARAWPASTCTSVRARPWRWSAARAAARPRWSTCCRASTRPSAGRILLDGHDLQTLTLDSLRANIALVSQEIVLFNDSIFANIAYGGMGGAAEKDVIAAAEAAHAMDFIRETPEGLNTLIGENGLRLSGGQRQRLAIARAILKNAPLLILDEATSALDSESERQVQAALEALMRGRTTIVIAHRLSTIERADRIVVLERGRIVESGNARRAARARRRVRQALPHAVRGGARRRLNDDRPHRVLARLGRAGDPRAVRIAGPDPPRPRGEAALPAARRASMARRRTGACRWSRCRSPGSARSASRCSTGG